MNVQKISRKILPYLVGLVGLLGCDNAESIPNNRYVTREVVPETIPIGTEELIATYRLHNIPRNCIVELSDYIYNGNFVYNYGQYEYPVFNKVINTSEATKTIVLANSTSSGDVLFHHGRYTIYKEINQEITESAGTIEDLTITMP